MPTWLATLVIGGLTLVCNLAITAYYYGRLSQTVADHERQLTYSQNDRDNLWREVSKLGRGLEKVKGKVGVNGD